MKAAMKMSEKIGRIIWKIMNVVALIVSIIAAILSISAHFQVGMLAKLFREAENWEISINLSEPEDEAEVSGYVIEIAGNVDFRAMSARDKYNPRVNLQMQEQRVELVPFVKPLSESRFWWAQSTPVVRQDGSFTGSVFVGESVERGGAGIGVRFQIVVLAVRKGTVSEGMRFERLPSDQIEASNVVTVTRIE